MKKELKIRYRKQCEDCDTKISARARNKRVCPRCGGTLKKIAKRNKDESQHHGTNVEGK